jgi:hypothetical protein
MDERSGGSGRTTAADPAPADEPLDGAARTSRPAVAPRPRGFAEIRWRQFRGAPRPVVRAVLSSLIVAVVLASAYVAYDLAVTRTVAVPGGDLRVLFVAVYVVLVLAIGSLATYLFVPQPSGSGSTRRRSGWSAALGFFAAVPVAYLVMVVAVQIVRPLLG